MVHLRVGTLQFCEKLLRKTGSSLDNLRRRIVVGCQWKIWHYLVLVLKVLKYFSHFFTSRVSRHHHSCLLWCIKPFPRNRQPTNYLLIPYNFHVPDQAIAPGLAMAPPKLLAFNHEPNPGRWRWPHLSRPGRPKVRSTLGPLCPAAAVLCRLVLFALCTSIASCMQFYVTYCTSCALSKNSVWFFLNWSKIPSKIYVF